MAIYESFEFESLRFSKDGKSIIAALNGSIERKMKKVEALKAQIATIAKNRGLTVEEVIEAGDDNDAVESYSTKMSANSGIDRNKPSTLTGLMKEVVDALEKDAKALRSAGREASQVRKDVEQFTRVRNALQETRSYELTYHELRDLGFN